MQGLWKLNLTGVKLYFIFLLWFAHSYRSWTWLAGSFWGVTDRKCPCPRISIKIWWRPIWVMYLMSLRTSTGTLLALTSAIKWVHNNSWYSEQDKFSHAFLCSDLLYLDFKGALITILWRHGSCCDICFNQAYGLDSKGPDRQLSLHQIAHIKATGNMRVRQTI